MIIPDGTLWMVGRETLGEHLERRGVSRRTFLRFCATMAAVISAGGVAAGDKRAAAATPESIARALGSVSRPLLVWLQLQECTGCMESALRSGDTTIEELILNLVSMNYNELLMAAAGSAADEALAAANAQDHILVVNGSIPLGAGGAYATIGGRSAKDVLLDSAKRATSIFAVGACAHWGCVQASRPNPTGAVGVDRIIKNKRVINVAGCPPIGEVITASLVYTLAYGEPPPTDAQGRPLFAYGNRIHDYCPRRARFDAGQFVTRFDDGGARDGYCLYEVGCRGPETFAPCPIVQWNLRADWPIGVGHPCIGCTEPGFYDNFTPFYQVLPNLKVPGLPVEADAQTVGLAALGVVAAGVAVHATATAVWERRAAHAADRTYLPLLGDTPTRPGPDGQATRDSGAASGGRSGAASGGESGAASGGQSGAASGGESGAPPGGPPEDRPASPPGTDDREDGTGA